MNEEQARTMEEIQRSVVKLLAVSPAGHGLCLIGGFRYRFLDQSSRLSVDIDYHWVGDLAAKQAELVSLFNRRLLPEIKRRFGLDGYARPATGPEVDSPAVCGIDLAFWRLPDIRIEIPVEITRIVCLDAPIVRTADGVVYSTPSNADLIESKVIALFNRRFLQHRDFVDLFLFSNHLVHDAAERVKTKLAMLVLDQETVAARLDDFSAHPDYHIRSISAVIEGQLDPAATANIQAAGGAKMVFEVVQQLLQTRLKLPEGRADGSA